MSFAVLSKTNETLPQSKGFPVLKIASSNSQESESRRVILHIDFDSFFASCEQQMNPEFRGKPLGVTATNGRTCIIGASREAKKLGIGSPSRTFDAKKIYPNIILTAAHFDEYWNISKKFISICKDYSHLTEVFSLDEVFMDITNTRYLYGGTSKLIKHLRKRIREEIGEYITVSIGVSFNKLLAKLGSGIDKPNGLVVISKKNLEAVYAVTRLNKICGIGHRIHFRLNAIGIFTLLDLRDAPLSNLIHEFGNIEGHFLKNVGLGIDHSQVIPYTEAIGIKSVGRNYCLPKNEFSQRIVLQNIFELCEEIGIKLRRLNKRARAVGLGLSGNRSAFGHISRGSSIHTGKEIFQGCRALYDRWQWGIDPDPNLAMVRQMSVWAGNLEENIAIPLSLFENTQKQETITNIVDQVNNRFGDHTIRNAFLLYSDKLTTKPNGFMADKYEREILRTEF